jgi:hypothetical protein
MELQYPYWSFGIFSFVDQLFCSDVELCTSSLGETIFFREIINSSINETPIKKSSKSV